MDKLFKTPAMREPVKLEPRKVEPTRKLTACLARQYSDSIRCTACGLSWEANDPEPPLCPHTGLPAGPVKA